MNVFSCAESLSLGPQCQSIRMFACRRFNIGAAEHTYMYTCLFACLSHIVEHLPLCAYECRLHAETMHGVFYLSCTRFATPCRTPPVLTPVQKQIYSTTSCETTHAYTNIYTSTYIRTYIHTFVHTYVHTHINAYIHTYIQLLFVFTCFLSHPFHIHPRCLGSFAARV